MAQQSVIYRRREAGDSILDWHNEISFKAQAILKYLLGKPDGWEFYVADIVKRSADGKTAVKNGIEELEEAGYVYREKRRDSGGRFSGLNWYISADPGEVTAKELAERETADSGAEGGSDEKPDSGEKTRGKRENSPVTGFPVSGNQKTVAEKEKSSIKKEKACNSARKSVEKQGSPPGVSLEQKGDDPENDDSRENLGAPAAEFAENFRTKWDIVEAAKGFSGDKRPFSGESWDYFESATFREILYAYLEVRFSLEATRAVVHSPTYAFTQRVKSYVENRGEVDFDFGKFAGKIAV